MSSTHKTTPFEIRNHAALAAFAKRFAPTINQAEEAPTPPSNVDFFTLMNLPGNIELSDSIPYTIDVQSDFRYIFAFICFYVTNLYPEYNVKGHPSISPPSLIAYCLALVYAHFLTCDLSARKITSSYATIFRNDAHLKDFLSVLLNAFIPPFLMPLLSQLAPTTDPRRTHVEFVPSLAGFSFLFDFGRTIPISALLRAHHLVATTRSNRDPDDVLLDLYVSPLITIDTTTYHIGNLFGTHYHDGNQDFRHSNWLNSILESIFNPVVGRALTQKPTFTRIPLNAQTCASFTDVNPYIYCLSANDDDIGTITDFINAGSRFIRSETPSALVLGQVLQTISGITILNHFIAPATLPTWTDKSITATTTPTREANPTEFARTNQFLVAPRSPTGKIAFPPDLGTTPPILLLMTDVDHNPDHYPIVFELFRASRNITPYVQYFQPYDVSPSSLAYTISLGIQIEQSHVDGFTIPTVNPYSSLVDNNSQIKQSAIQLTKLHPANMCATATISRLRIDLTSDTQATGIAIQNMSINSLPTFNRTAVPDPFPDPLPGFHRQANHTDPNYGFTYAAFRQKHPTTLPDDYIYAWSSYRFVEKVKSPSDTDRFFILSFRTIYGTNVTTSRSRHPTLMIPK